MDIVTAVGLFASLLTSSSLIPQLVKIIREKNADNVSPVMLMALLAGHAAWIWYGGLKEDMIIIISNGFAAIIDVVTLLLRLKYGKKEGLAG